MMQSVKIIGKGVLSPLGSSVSQVFQSVNKGEHAWREIRQFDAAGYFRRDCGVLSEEMDARLEELYPEETRASAFCCFAGEQAVAGRKPSGRRLLVLASNFGQMVSRQWCWRERLDTGVISAESYAPVAESAKRLAERFQCTEVLEVTNSCSSGVVALAVAKDWISSGRVEEALVIGYDEISEFSWGGLTALHTVTAGEMMPFDARRSGTVFSEGAVAMLLAGENSPEEAQAWLSGCATGNNAFHITAPCVDGAGSLEVMRGCLADAGLAVSEVSAVVAHATSTVGNDRTEATALRTLFGESLPPIGAWKPFLGHALGGAGLLEGVLAVEAMQTGVFSVVQVGQLADDCACIQGMHEVRVPFTSILVNSAGIGGNNAAVFLTRGKCCPERTRYSVVEQQAERQESASGRIAGYQDPVEQRLLGALREMLPEGARNLRRGIVVYSQFGCLKSSWEFYAGLVRNGPRRASPMVFPHTYTNMPGCLAAIAFGCAGPHATFTGGEGGERAAELFAQERIADGSADEMVLICLEEPCATAVPDGMEIVPRLVVRRFVQEK